MKIKFHWVNTPNDPQKAVTPTLLYYKDDQDKDYTAYTFTFGWWHWGLMIMFIKRL